MPSPLPRFILLAAPHGRFRILNLATFVQSAHLDARTACRLLVELRAGRSL